MEEWLQYFNSDYEYIIWGCTEFTEALLAVLRDIMKVKGIVDRNPELTGTRFCGIPVYHPEILKEKDKNVKVIISNRFMGTRKQIENQLEEMGYVKGKDFSYYEFFISIWSWKYKNQIAASYIETSITTFCSLRCKKCAGYIPFIKKPRHRELEDILGDVDKLFGVFDFIARFRLLGGEPLIYPHLLEVIDAIGKKYRGKIGEFTIVTNGTIIPSDDLLKTMKRYNANFSVSDYSGCGSRIATSDQYKNFMKKCDENQVRYFYNKLLRWMDLGSPIEKQNLSENELRTRYEDCKLDRRSLFNGKVYACVNQASAHIGGLYGDKADGDDLIKLDDLSGLSKKEAFDKWYLFDTVGTKKQGYISFCDYCNGEGSLNANFIPVAEQCNER